MKKFLLYLLSFILFSVKDISAAEIKLFNSSIILSGPITSGDYQRIKNLSNNLPYKQRTIFLDSPGGAAYEGMKIAEYIHDYGFRTIVIPGAQCYSACAIIWAGGIDRFASLPNSIIGFHAVYNPYTLNEVGSANALLGAMLGRFGYSNTAIEFMTLSGPKELSYLTQRSSRVMGINYTDFAKISDDFIKYPRKTLSGYDVVKGFYNALSIADGDLAAAYIVPEKRGLGPFNQVSIYKFYSSLNQPLTVNKIIKINETEFEVNYQYVAGSHKCQTSALVSVVNYNGINLIKKIKAKC